MREVRLRVLDDLVELLVRVALEQHARGEGLEGRAVGEARVGVVGDGAAGAGVDRVEAEVGVELGLERGEGGGRRRGCSGSVVVDALVRSSTRWGWSSCSNIRREGLP